MQSRTYKFKQRNQERESSMKIAAVVKKEKKIKIHLLLSLPRKSMQSPRNLTKPVKRIKLHFLMMKAMKKTANQLLRILQEQVSLQLHLIISHLLLSILRQRRSINPDQLFSLISIKKNKNSHQNKAHQLLLL